MQLIKIIEAAYQLILISMAFFVIMALEVKNIWQSKLGDILPWDDDIDVAIDDQDFGKLLQAVNDPVSEV